MLETQLARGNAGRSTSELEARRLRRVLEEGLSCLDEVLHSDMTAARQALRLILPEKVLLTPIDLPSGVRTYQFEGRLALGRIASTIRQNHVDVPDGI